MQWKVWERKIYYLVIDYGTKLEILGLLDCIALAIVLVLALHRYCYFYYNMRFNSCRIAGSILSLGFPISVLYVLHFHKQPNKGMCAI